MRQHFYFLVLFTTSVMGLSSCNTNRLQRPTEKYLNAEEEKISILQVPVRFSLSELELMLNQQLDGVLYEDDTFEDGDRLKIKAVKKEDIQFRMGDQRVHYRVPLELDILYDLGLGRVGADATIALQFRTEYRISDTWALETRTIVEEYEWIEKPRVSLGGLRIPVASIGNFFLRRSQDVLGANIDKAIANNLDLRAQIQQAWGLLNTPYEVSPDYRAWLQIHPDSLQMTPLVVKDDSLSATIAVFGRPALSFGPRPEVSVVDTLPAFRYAEETDGQFSVLVSTILSYPEAERLAQQQLQGETFSQGKRSVTVESIKLFGQGEKLIMDLQLRGAYTGSIYLEGYPIYNPQKNTLDIRDLDFNLQTKNFLHRSGAWLLKGTIKNKIEKNMNLLLSENLAEIKEQIQAQIQDYQPLRGVKLNGYLNEMNLQTAYLSADGIQIRIKLEGTLSIEVKGLSTVDPN